MKLDLSKLKAERFSHKEDLELTSPNSIKNPMTIPWILASRIFLVLKKV